MKLESDEIKRIEVERKKLQKERIRLQKEIDQIWKIQINSYDTLQVKYFFIEL